MRKFKITNRRHQGMLLSVYRNSTMTLVPIPGRRVTEVMADDLNWNQVRVMKSRGYVEVEEISGGARVATPVAKEPQKDTSASSATSVEKEPPPEPPVSDKKRSSGRSSKTTDDK